MAMDGVDYPSNVIKIQKDSNESTPYKCQYDQTAINLNANLNYWYYINYIIQQKSMIFGPQFISPPLFYYFIHPYNYQITPTFEEQQILCHSSLLTPPQANISEPNSQNPELTSKIVVTKEDLIEEGYEILKKAWTEEQDQLLLKLCSDPNALFDQIAPFLPGRNAKMCYSRYRRLTNQSKQSWTRADNQKLRSLVQQYGQDKWREILPFFPSRNHKQLKDHYQNYLKSNIQASQWKLEEDLELIKLINEHGQNWKYIQTLMPKRSRNQLKNRFFGRIKRLNNKKLNILHKNESSQ